MNVGATFGAHAEFALAWQPRQRPLHNPSNRAQPTPVRSPAAGDLRSNATTSQPLAVWLRVVGTVGVHFVRSTTGPAPFAANRRNRVDQRFQLLHVRDIGGRYSRSQGRAVGINDDVVFAPLF